jgi:dTDP-4-dehydrorhamnose reductase
MRILLTGSGGQVGSALRTTLVPLGEVLAPGRTELDLARPEGLRSRVAAMRPDLIVNAAAYTDVEGAESDEAAAFAVNAESVAELATAARACGALLVHYSTDYVFDGSRGAPYAEDAATHPLSVYGRSKLDGERRILASGCEHLILRTSWVYEARGRNFLLTMLRLGRERDRLRIVDDQLGAPTWATALARGTAELLAARMRSELLRARTREGELLHLTNDGWTSWYGFAQAIFESQRAAGERVPQLDAIASDEFPTRARRPLDSRLSCERAARIWGLRLPHWRDSLAECLRVPKAGSA